MSTVAPTPYPSPAAPPIGCPGCLASGYMSTDDATLRLRPRCLPAHVCRRNTVLLEPRHQTASTRGRPGQWKTTRSVSISNSMTRPKHSLIGSRPNEWNQGCAHFSRQRFRIWRMTRPGGSHRFRPGSWKRRKSCSATGLDLSHRKAENWPMDSFGFSVNVIYDGTAISHGRTVRRGALHCMKTSGRPYKCATHIGETWCRKQSFCSGRITVRRWWSSVSRKRTAEHGK